jgi:glycosyltransferase involved in cell wall biosynthesis
VPSRYTRARLLDNFPNAAGKVFVVPEGVDRKRFTRRGPVETERVRQLYCLPQRYLLAVGTLQTRKNLHRLLAAWRLVGPRLPGSGLVIAGGHGPQYRKLAWETLPPATYFLGYVPECDLPALYSAALAYILPSLEEGFGLTLLEAMACGTPVLASRAGAIPEVLGEAGQLFDPAQPVEIAAQIEELFGDEHLRAGLVARGQSRARQFTWAETARQTLSLLHSIT